MKKLNLKQIIFLLLFFAIIFSASRITLFKVVGSSQAFTLFEFLYPLPVVFLGGIWGAGIILLVKVINWLTSSQGLDLITVVRFFPAIIAALYFVGKSKWNIVVPIGCMILFWLHPIGRAGFPYGLFWLIPIIALPFKRNLALNALGTTFTAHAVGSTAFLYSVGLTPEIWRGLIPVVMMERFVFAAGISLSLIVFSVVVKFVEKKINKTEIVTRKI